MMDIAFSLYILDKNILELQYLYKQHVLNFRTGFKHIPCIHGKEIDLYLLYWLVTAQGGWERVSDFNVLSSF